MTDTTTLNAMLATPARCELNYATDCEGTATNHDIDPTGYERLEDTSHGWEILWYCDNCAYQIARDN